MPLLFIMLHNAEYIARDEGNEYGTPEAALAAGTRSAIAMAYDEIERGRQGAAIVIKIEQEDGTCLLTSVVSVSVSPLMVAKPD